MAENPLAQVVNPTTHVNRGSVFDLDAPIYMPPEEGRHTIRLIRITPGQTKPNPKGEVYYIWTVEYTLDNEKLSRTRTMFEVDASKLKSKLIREFGKETGQNFREVVAEAIGKPIEVWFEYKPRPTGGNYENWWYEEPPTTLLPVEGELPY